MNKKRARKEQAEKVKKLENEVRDLVAKLEFIARCVETEEGVFTWPNGDWIQTRKTKGRQSEVAAVELPAAESDLS